MWIGLDDTDSRRAGCTTWLATEVLGALPDHPPVDRPRLVRLNPMAPWKTRGNGAVALHLEGAATTRALDRVWTVVARWAETERGADPGVLLCPDDAPPRRALYEAAATRVVDRGEVLPDGGPDGTGPASPLALPDGALHRGGRGVLGAAAAVAWEPGDRTFEVLAYRERDRWGTPRAVTPASVRRADLEVPGAFDCHDWTSDEATMVPNGPDPVLFGLRGDDAEALVQGRHLLEGEPVDRWVLWETNQGTDDHLTRQAVGRLVPCSCPVVEGVVATQPRTIEGGHVLVDVTAPGGVAGGDDRGGHGDGHADGNAFGGGDGAADARCTLAAYEPTRTFRDVVRALRPGDRVVALGGTRDGATVNLEKLHVEAVADLVAKVENPTCPACRRRMKSAGRDAGYRCRRCGTSAGEAEARFERVPRAVGPGWHEVPVAARRHLAKPLKRFPRAPPGRGRVALSTASKMAAAHPHG